MAYVVDKLQKKADDGEGKRSEYILPHGLGRIVSYHPFDSMQIIFYEVHTSELPDLWDLGFRVKNNSTYFRTLICKQGECEFSVNGVRKPLRFGQAMIEYGFADNGSFSFSSDRFTGVEIKICINEIARDSIMFKMLGYAILGMTLPLEEISESNGYIVPYSRDTEQTIDKLMKMGFDGEDVMILAHTIEIVHYICTDIEKLNKTQEPTDERQLAIARDIHNSLTEDFGSKWTAGYFANKYGLSDTTVKKYFKNVYGYGFKEYQNKIRMEWAENKLRTTDMTVCLISEMTGYSSQTKFTNAFKNYFGTTPQKYRGMIRVHNSRKNYAKKAKE